MCAVRRSFTHPGCPKSHGSRWPLAKPHDVISLIAHSPAAFRLGEPVTRGPYTSASMCSVCMIRECAFSSARIFALMSASSRGWAASGASSATQAIRTEKRLSMGVILLLLTSGRRRAYIQSDDDADPRVHGSPPGRPAGGHRCTARVRRKDRRAGASGAGAGRRANGARDTGAVAVAALAWLIRGGIDYRRWLRATKVQVDAHTKIVDRLASNEDLLAYMNSAAGQRFLTAVPATATTVVDAAAMPVSAPINRILWSVQAGVVLTVAGAGLFLAKNGVVDEAAQAMQVLAILIMALGLGFVLSALASWALSRQFGLLASHADHA